MARPIEMSMRVFVTSNREIQIAEIIFHAPLITLVAGLFVVETRRGIFNQRAIQIILAVFRGSQSAQHQPIFKVKRSLEDVIRTAIHQRLSLVIKVERAL